MCCLPRSAKTCSPSWRLGATTGVRIWRASTAYIFATSLEIAGVPRPPSIDAVSLLPILRGALSPTEPRELYFVRREGGPAYGGKTYEALIRGDWKLLQNSPYAPLELYNLKDDPQEQRDLFAAQPKIARELQAALRRHVQRGGSTPWQPAPSSP